MTDKVFPVKMEHSSLGGTQNDDALTAINPTEDGLVAKELWLISDETNPATDTIQQGIKIDGSHNIVLYDRVTGEKTLATIIAGATLPEYSAADAGKVLTVQSNGTLAWQFPTITDVS